MKRHKVLGHTADVRLWVEADSLIELFEVALEGMAGLIKDSRDEKQPSRNVKESIDINAPDQTALLIDFLSEALTLSHNRKAVFDAVEIEKLTEQNLKGTISGYQSDGFDEDIKAVTYHEAEIRKNENGSFETVIDFDI